MLLLLVPLGSAVGVGSYYYFQPQSPCQQIAYSVSPGWTNAPTVGKEALNMDTYAFASNGTQVQLYIRNSGGSGSSSPIAFDNVTLKNTGSQSVQIFSIGPGLYSQPGLTLAPGESKLITTLQSGNVTLVTSLGVNNEVHLCYHNVKFVAPNSPPPPPAPSFTTTLQTYYVKDSSGNTWAMPNWNGPTTSSNQVATATINIGPSSGAQYTGTAGAFNTFASGFSYTITLVTSRNNQFSYSVVR